jgi:hypothetical protein
MSRYIMLLGLSSVIAMAAAGGADGSPKGGKKPRIDKTAVHENKPGETDDTIDITLDDGSTVIDTPLNIIKRVQAGEFTLQQDDAEAVADLHNGAVLDPAKDTGDAEIVDPGELVKTAEAPQPDAPAVPSADSTTGSSNTETPFVGSGSAPAETTSEGTAPVNLNTSPDQQELPPEQKVIAQQQPKDPAVNAAKRPDTEEPESQVPPAAEGQPVITNSDTGLAGAAPQIREAPGGSTQTDSATTVSGSPVITEDNPVVQEVATTVQTAPTPASVTDIAPPPEANAGNAPPAENATPPQNTLNPRAQEGSDVVLTGAKAASDAAKVEPGTWTPSAALSPQEPTTLAEAAHLDAVKAAETAPADPMEELRAQIAKFGERLTAVEEHQDEIDRDLTQVEEKLAAL